MNLSDSFYVALCMTVLMLGIVYWFWTQNQYIQRKLNLLENIVYEMKSSMSHTHAPDPIDRVLAAAAAPGPSLSINEVPDTPIAEAAPTPFAEDDADSIDAALDAFDVDQGATEAPIAAPLADSDITPIVADELFEDLTPGGSAASATAVAGETDVSDLNNESVLNGMGLKELRELAKQKGVANPKNLRKHELVSAIRASKTSVTPFEIREGTLELN
jgi:hypothetical protein